MTNYLSFMTKGVKVFYDLDGHVAMPLYNWMKRVVAVLVHYDDDAAALCFFYFNIRQI